MNKNKAAFLDWDTTTADVTQSEEEHGLPETMVEAILRLHRNGYKTTFNTARDPIELLDVIGKKWDILASKDMLVGTEYGGRIGSIEDDNGKPRFKTVKHFPLSKKELDILIDVARRFDGVVMKFYANDEKQQLVWTNDEGLIPGIQKKFHLNSGILTCSIEELRELLYSTEPSNIIVEGEIVLPNNLNYSGGNNSYTVNAQKVNKEKSLNYIAEELDIDLHESVVAGDSEPDIPMLNTTDIGTKVLVGEDKLPTDKNKTTYVSNAKELGEFLLTLEK